MVLINNLTLEEINAALLKIQRSRNEVVGGVKGDTIQNITIQNNGGSSASVPDFTPVINSIIARLEELGLKDEEIDNKLAQIGNTLSELVDRQIVNLRFSDETRELFIDFENGDYLAVNITSENISFSLDSQTEELTLHMGNNTASIVLPYIRTSEKGVAGGVATLDNTGRIPYSQLPESAMEFEGEWDASTNTPTLADGTGVNGEFYIVSVGGTVNFGTVAEPREVTFYPNDRVIYEGTTEEWIRLPAGSVVSVNGMSGAVTLDADDIPYDQNMSVKEKLDEGGTQADWTETSSSSPAFIKHKIPIWITNGQNNENVLSVFDTVHPVGEIYIQYPGKKSPNTLWGDFSTWTDITSDYDGAFFRAYKNGVSDNFVDDGDTLGSPQASQNLSHDHGGNSGSSSPSVSVSGTAARVSLTGDSSKGCASSSSRSGIFSSYYSAEKYSMSGSQGNYGGLHVDASHSHSVSASGTVNSHTHSITAEGGTEARPINYAIKIWERTA